MYTGWGTAEMVAHAVKGELERVGVKLQLLGRDAFPDLRPFFYFFLLPPNPSFVRIEVAWICESNRDKCNYLAHAFKLLACIHRNI